MSGKNSLIAHRENIGAALNGICVGVVGAVLGFTITDWQWWLVMAAMIVARINGQETTYGMRIGPRCPS